MIQIWFLFFFFQVTLTYPLDTIRARLAFQVTGEHKYSGIVHTALSVMKNVSISATYTYLLHFLLFNSDFKFGQNVNWSIGFDSFNRKAEFEDYIVALCQHWPEWFHMRDFRSIALKVWNFCAWNMHHNIHVENAKRTLVIFKHTSPMGLKVINWICKFVICMTIL